MLEAFFDALNIVFQWPNIIYPVLGTIFGEVVGLLPGMGGATAIVLLLPLTYGMDTHLAMLLLMSTSLSLWLCQ